MLDNLCKYRAGSNNLQMRKKEARSPSGSDRGLLSTNMLSYDTEQLDKISQNAGQREYSILIRP